MQSLMGETPKTALPSQDRAASPRPRCIPCLYPHTPHPTTHTPHLRSLLKTYPCELPTLPSPQTSLLPTPYSLLPISKEPKLV
ncbi:hypothetical protein [Moorena sp. SIO3H5]|uniref:hypothetical protein n=1 Tax=Moorena sp. SIO3H5 TaxID=2607834 RepID=UPI0013BC97EE|nr:hypothetical protein [Moorena sp. SIO3H5]NEO74443.1 hypothetical protein [Moorena sp. SIO3H5]